MNGRFIPAAKKLAYWTVPPGVYQKIKTTYESVKARRIPAEIQEKCRSNQRLKNRYEGERCFLLATGSSISEQDLTPLKEEFCIGMSMFFLHEHIETIDPSFYVFAPNHSPYDFNLPKKYLKGFNESVNDCNLFIGYRSYEYSFYRFLQQHPSYKPDQYSYINYEAAPRLTEQNCTEPSRWDISRRPFGVRTTFIAAIQIAAYLGFDEIYLLGADYDYLEHHDEGEVKHFYDPSKGINEARSGATEELFEGYYRSWKDFNLIRESIEDRNQRIYNATKGGMLDVFPRKSLEKVLNQ